ncbi:Sorbitol dehydrogenase [Holothuria leucospilota]|uniref:Sorbitol dehydrogenase n=1 Tax=Holothuria leucospilota TaxID=206669 RepID=A0A9Q1H151_HOLLE|nr:Sorbitol dehydrogenase [Holothuria leucospilota]
MQRVGICGSDVHFKQHGGIGDYKVKSPIILGHESSGVVSAVGANVQHLKVGDRVAIEPGVPCRKCKFCKQGRYNLCANCFFLACPPDDGSLRRYHCHAADFCFKLPDKVSLDEGALMEPLSVAIHACLRAGLKLGDKVLVLGAGPIGLVCLMTSKAMGAAKVAITDIQDDRLSVANRLGASACIKIDESDPQKMAEKIHTTLGWKPDITIECSGVESSFQMGIYGSQGYTFIFPLFRYPTALSMIADGLVDVKPLITHRFSLKESAEAFNTAETCKDNAIKVMIHCDE